MRAISLMLTMITVVLLAHVCTAGPTQVKNTDLYQILDELEFKHQYQRYCFGAVSSGKLGLVRPAGAYRDYEVAPEPPSLKYEEFDRDGKLLPGVKNNKETAKEARIDGPFLAGFYKDKIIGAAAGLVSPVASSVAFSKWIMMDSDFKVIKSKEYRELLVRRSDALTVDNSGRAHLVFRDLYADAPDLEAAICHICFDRNGEIVEKTELARVKHPIPDYEPRMSITPDIRGTIYIYFVENVNYGAGIDKDAFEITCIEHRPKTPAVGRRTPIAVAAKLGDVFAVDELGKQKRIPRRYKPVEFRRLKAEARDRPQ